MTLATPNLLQELVGSCRILGAGVLVATPHQVRSHQRAPGDKAADDRSGFRVLSDSHHAPSKDGTLTNPKGPCRYSIHAQSAKKLPL